MGKYVHVYISVQTAQVVCGRSSFSLSSGKTFKGNIQKLLWGCDITSEFLLKKQKYNKCVVWRELLFFLAAQKYKLFGINMLSV